jgi:acyl CoA:acetate/3-ketoacid CoA transferase beta subunit
VLRRVDGDFVVEQIADGFTFDELQGLTDLELKVAAGVR